MNIEIKEKLAHKHSGQYYKTKKGVSKEGKNDDYSTPNEAWDEIIQFLPNKKAKIYEPFYLDGGSGNYLKSQGLNIIHENMDFYENVQNFVGKTLRIFFQKNLLQIFFED